MNENSRRWLAGLAVIAIFAALQPSVFAQGFTAVTGSVMDPTGAVIPGVEVTVTNAATGASRTVITNETGSYTVAQLSPGVYNISASLPGFSTQVMSGVTLPVGGTVVVNLPLEVGAVTDVVDVISSVGAVNTVDAKLGVAFDTQKIIDLPLNARNIVGLLGLQSGVTQSDQSGEFGRDDGGQVNGARNDQQNIVLDGVNINRQEAGSAFEGAIPTTLDSVQEFLVSTAGSGGTGARGSGAQVSLVTKSGSNQWHGSAYEYYRSQGTSATNYFLTGGTQGDPTRLIRNLPGGSFGGPIIKDKLFLFGAYERQTDRSATVATRTIPTPQFLDGIVRYERKDGSFAELTQGCGSMLERFSGIPCDTWNSNVIGPNGLLEVFRPFANGQGGVLSPGEDNGANQQRFRFQSPFVRNRNVYISRLDFTASENHTFFFRGTLNDDSRTLGAEALPGGGDSRLRLDNSKGFAASWNWVISPSVNSNFTAGLTRESFEDSGINTPTWSYGFFSQPFVDTGASRQAIDTWNFVENFSWLRGNHNIQFGGNTRYMTNARNSFNDVNPGSYSGGANLTANNIGVSASPGFARAVGDAEFANAVSAHSAGDAVMTATGSISQFSEDIQFDVDGNKLAAGIAFTRRFRMQEYDFYLQDTWRATSNLTVTFGVNYSVQTPPYEADGLQVNWMENLGNRLRVQSDTTKTITELPLFTTQTAGRANDAADYYSADTNNWAPRVSFAWTPSNDWLNTGGQLVLRGGYNMTYDAMGRRFARDAAGSGSIGLKTRFGTPGFSNSFDGLDGAPRAPRIGGEFGFMPRGFFPTVGDAPSNVVPIGSGGAGGVSSSGIDPGLYSPTSHLLNLTISKELPGDWVVEASYVGRFARNLVGQADIASPVNVRDAISGQTYYQAIKTMYERDEANSTPIDDIIPIPWFENVYSKAIGVSETRLGRKADGTQCRAGSSGCDFPFGATSATQAFYALLHKSRAPGPNTSASLVDEIQGIERRAGPTLLSPQVHYFGLFTNLGRSNYNSGQLTVRKRFSQGVNWTMNYTFSKSLDITSAAEARGNRANGATNEGMIEDPYNPDLNYGISDFNRTHQFNSNFLVQLPFGQGRPFLSNISKVANHIIGGWEFSGIMQATSGRPWQFTASSRYNHHYYGRTIPHMIKAVPFCVCKDEGRQVFLVGPNKQNRIDVTNGAEYFIGAYPGGSIQRNQGLGPNFWNIDAAITKNFTVTEDIRARLRVETFNVANHPNFNIPTGRNGRSIDRHSGLLGQVTSTRGTERVMQFSFRLEF